MSEVQTRRTWTLSPHVPHHITPHPLKSTATDSKSQIDYDLFATKANLKGAKSARDSFTPLYNKIVAGLKTSGAVASANGGDNGDDEASSSPKKKATPKKRKAGGMLNQILRHHAVALLGRYQKFCVFKADLRTSNDSEGENGSPTKKATPGKKTKGQKKKSNAAAAADDEEGEDSIVVKSEPVEPQDEEDD